MIRRTKMVENRHVRVAYMAPDNAVVIQNIANEEDFYMVAGTEMLEEQYDMFSQSFRDTDTYEYTKDFFKPINKISIL